MDIVYWYGWNMKKLNICSNSDLEFLYSSFFLLKLQLFVYQVFILFMLFILWRFCLLQHIFNMPYFITTI